MMGYTSCWNCGKIAYKAIDLGEDIEKMVIGEHTHICHNCGAGSLMPYRRGEFDGKVWHDEKKL